MRDRLTRARGMLAGPAATGIAAALIFVGALALVGGPDMARLLFATANGLGAAMLVVALSGLFGCAAFATSLAMDETRPGRGLAQPSAGKLARARIRSAAP